MIICLLIPVSAVSASDINNTAADNQVLSATPNVDTISANVNNGENNNDTLSVQNDEKNILSAGPESGNDILSANDDVGSYSDLNELIKLTDSGSTLKLLKSYEYKSSSESAGIVISKPITIDGNGFTINGKNTAPGFSILADNVILKNINIINCVSPKYDVSYAGAVYWLGDNGKLINTNITNCKITTGTYATSGGISWWGKDGEITLVNVSKCTSPNGDRRGDMLSCAGIDLKISQSDFHDIGTGFSNFASIAVLGSSANVAFNKCTFRNIASGSYGQFFYEATSGLKFKDCIFNDTKGPFIFARGSDVQYDDCEFYCNNKVFAYNALHYATFNHCKFDSFSNILNQNVPITNTDNGMKDNSYTDCTFIYCKEIYKPYVESVDSYINCDFYNCTDVFMGIPTTGYMIVTGCTFNNTTTSKNDAVIAVTGGQKNVIENNVFEDIPDTITRDIYVTSTAGAYINNPNARVVNDGKSISKIDELYVTETGTGTGTGSWANACNITYALINIMKDGKIHLKKGTYDLEGQVYPVNFIIDNENEVCFKEGSLMVKNGYSIHDLIFTNLTKAVELGFHSNISNCTFENFKCNEFDPNYRTPVYLSYTANLFNCTFKNITAEWIIGHYVHGINSITADIVNVTNCTLTTAFLSTTVGSNSKFSNIYINNTTLGRLFILSGTGVYQDVNNIEFDTVYINSSTFTQHVYSSDKDYARKVSFNHLTINNTHTTGYANIFNGLTNTVFDDINIINYYTTNANKKASVFFPRSTGINSLKNINIVNYTSEGFIIYNSKNFIFGDVSLYNVTTSSFTNVVVSDMTLSGLNFNKTNFTNNIIFQFADNVVLKDSNFTDYIGHIVVEGSSLTFSNNRFINGNNSLLNGSAIWLDGNYVIFDKCTFTGNNASYGAVYITNTSLKPSFTNCNFKGNNATGLNTGNVTGLGGAIYINTIEGQEFALSLDSYTNATLDNKNKYYNNLFMKGAMKKLYSTVYVVLDPDNWHPETGSSDGNARENATSFTNAWLGVGPGTVFIFVNASEVYDYTNAPVNVFNGIDRNLVFRGNDTTLVGARFTVNAPAVNMKVYNFTYCNVTSGPAIIWNSTGGYMENCTFKNNGGENIAYGGAIQVLKNNLTLNKTSFINNTAGNPDAGYGGALYINASSVKIEKCIFDSNNVYNTGSHIYVDSNLEEIRITDSKFDNGNKYIRPIQGSGVVVQGSNINVLRNNFTNNTGRVGSGVYVMGDIANSNINNNKFENNTAKSIADDGYAAALYTKFTNKKYSANSISENTFINNVAQLNGGAWYIDSIDTTGLTLDTNVFNGNNATNGGAVYINMPDLTFIAEYTANNAVNGGAVYINSNNVVLSDSSFEDNNATNGGAVYIKGDNAVLTNNYFTANKANDGGALYVDANNTHVSDSEFKDNIALNHGSAIYVADDEVITLTNTILSGNSAGKDIISEKKYDDISYAGTLPSINGKFIIDDLSEGALYYINRTEIKSYMEVYITNDGTGTGGINDPTNWENAVTKILKDGIIYIVCDNFKVNNHMIELLKNANLTNVTIVGINKTKITRDGDVGKYLFNQLKKINNFYLNNYFSSQLSFGINYF